MLPNEFCVDEDTITRSFQGLFNHGFHRKGKNVSWLKVVTMTYLSADRKALQIFVQVNQVLIFSIAHCFISVLIDHIFVFSGREKLQWIHWKFHYT